MSNKVTCIRKNLPGDHYSHITHIGGGVWGPITVKQAIVRILVDPKAFYTESATTGPFLIAVPEGNPTYVRTNGDSKKDNNLLALPECS